MKIPVIMVIEDVLRVVKVLAGDEVGFDLPSKACLLARDGRGAIFLGYDR